jgi:hypothetical protein
VPAAAPHALVTKSYPNKEFGMTLQRLALAVPILLCAAALRGQPDDAACTLKPRVLINAQYGTTGPLTFYKVPNWVDLPEDGTDAPEPDASDNYIFTACTGVIPGSAQFRIGPRAFTGDPTVLQIGEWFYVTGTNSDAIVGPPAGSHSPDVNFPIYRTRDFMSFELHMFAFGRTDNGTASYQYIDWMVEPPRLHLNGNKWYTALWAPQLYMDPSVVNTDPYVYMNFSAVENGTYAAGDHSVFHVRIKRSKFLEWLTKNPYTDVTGYRFADKREASAPWQASFGRRGWGNVMYYDGGGCVAGAPVIPSSASALLLGGGCPTQAPMTPQTDQSRKVIRLPLATVNTNWGFQHNHQPVLASVLAIDPFMFIDPNPLATGVWRRTLIYCWDDRHGLTPLSTWGNHIAGMPAGPSQYVFDSSATALPFAANRSSYNRLFAYDLDAQTWGFLDNGALAGRNRWRNGAVGEGPTVFWLASTNRYYLVYGRNTVGGPSYQIVYRMTEPGQPLTSLSLQTWDQDTNVPEHMLLRATDHTRSGGWNFGGPEYFEIQAGDSTVYPYLAFHAQPDALGQPSTPVRTVFFKELTLEPDGSGRLKQLYECSFDPSRDIRFFRVPTTIAQRNTWSGDTDAPDDDGGGDLPIPPDAD